MLESLCNPTQDGEQRTGEGLKEERDPLESWEHIPRVQRQEAQTYVRWVEHHLRPWAVQWRKQQAEKEWKRVCTLTRVDSDNTQEILQRLNNAGVENSRLITHEQDSPGATETEIRRNCRIIEATSEPSGQQSPLNWKTNGLVCDQRRTGKRICRLTPRCRAKISNFCAKPGFSPFPRYQKFGWCRQ